MSTIIIYASSHGAAEESAAFLKERLDDVELSNIKENMQIDIAPFDTVVVGGSIHAGQIQRSIRRFVTQNQDALLQKRLGLYLCCMYEGERAIRQLETAYPEVLRRHASAVGLFGGRFDFDKMNVIERAIVKKVAGVTESVSKMNREAMVSFIEALTS
jgi:menaquinone-dependent protoporphyrinogen oxidase